MEAEQSGVVSYIFGGQIQKPAGGIFFCFFRFCDLKLVDQIYLMYMELMLPCNTDFLGAYLRTSVVLISFFFFEMQVYSIRAAKQVLLLCLGNTRKHSDIEETD